MPVCTWSDSSEHRRALAHLTQCVFSFPIQANPQHTPSREACHLIVSRVLPLWYTYNNSGNYIRFGLRIETGADRTIVDIFDIIQQVRGTYKYRIVDSHIQRVVLATEETTATQQVSHRPIKCQSRLWPQRGTKLNRSRHGDNPLLRLTGIQIATKSYAALYKQWHRPTLKRFIKPPYSISRVTSIDSDCCCLRPAFSATKRINYVPISFGLTRSPSFSRPHIVQKQGKLKYRGPSCGGCLELVKPAREPASSRPKPCASLKKPHESCPVGPSRKKKDRRVVRQQLFPQKPLGSGL